MEQPIINSKNKNEELIHPPQNYECLFDINAIPPLDKYYSDHFMDINEKGNYLSMQIIRTDFNKFNLKRIDTIANGIIYFFCAVLLPIIFIFAVKEKNLLIYICIGIDTLICVCLGLYYILFSFNNIYLTLDISSIIITNKARCRVKDVKYNIDEIQRAELYYNYEPDGKGPSDVYSIYLIQKSGTRQRIHKIQPDKKDIEIEGLKYFVDFINYHIMKNRS